MPFMEQSMYYDEIDLRIYAEMLVRHWMWIAGAVVISAIVAFGVSQYLPATYEAAALVAVTDARYVMQFDPRVETNEVQPSNAVFQDLAVSDDVLQRLWEELPEQRTDLDLARWQSLKDMVEVESGSDASLLRLTASSPNPEAAADIANTWAHILVRYVNDIYGGDADDLGFFTAQLDRAAAQLTEAESALVTFQAQNSIEILNNELSAKLAAQKYYLDQRDGINYLMQDIRDLRAQLASRPATYRITFGDRLTALSLQMKAFNAQSGIPIELQVADPDVLSDQSLAEQLNLLDELILTLQGRSLEVEQYLVALGPEILALQEELQMSRTELSRLTRAQTVADETYVTLSRKVEESKITAEDRDGKILLASRAAAPSSPVGPRKLLNTAIAGVAAGMVSVLVIFVLEWWRQDEETDTATLAQAPPVHS
jgi:polysaccharide biosynthesis transport protein